MSLLTTLLGQVSNTAEINMLDVKDSVRLASDPNANWTGTATADFVTSSLVLTISSLTAGASRGLIDGIEPVDGDRILLKDLATLSSVTTDSGAEATPGKYNGLWEVTGGTSTTLTLERTQDANIDSEVRSGLFTFVQEGSCADCGFVLSTVDPIILNTTSLSFSQFTGAGQITAGDGLSKTGNTLDVDEDDVTVYIDGSSKVAVKSSASANNVLLSDGTSTTPAWGALPLADSNSVTGLLSQINGGTGINSSAATDGQLLIGGTASNDLQLATISGTANQINVTNGTNSITLATPQDIATGSSPTFVGPTLTGILKTDAIIENTLNDGVLIEAALLKDGIVSAADLIGTTRIRTPFVEEILAADTGVRVDGVLLKDGEVNTDTINEATAAAGVTADGVLLKDGEVEAASLNAQSATDLTLKDGTGSVAIDIRAADGNVAINGSAGDTKFIVFGDMQVEQTGTLANDGIAVTVSGGGAGARLNLGAQLDVGNPAIDKLSYIQEDTDDHLLYRSSHGHIFNIDDTGTFDFTGGSGMGIGSAPNASTILDLTSTTQGFRTPSMTTAQRLAISSPATGLQVFDTDLGILIFFDGTQWWPVNANLMQGLANGVPGTGSDPAPFVGSGLDVIIFPKKATIFAISIVTVTARTLGTADAEFLVNGTPNAAVATLDAVNTTQDTNILATPVSLTAGDTLRLQVTTTGYTPTPSDIMVCVTAAF